MITKLKIPNGNKDRWRNPVCLDNLAEVLISTAFMRRRHKDLNVTPTSYISMNFSDHSSTQSHL